MILHLGIYQLGFLVWIFITFVLSIVVFRDDQFGGFPILAYAISLILLFSIVGAGGFFE